MKDTDNQLELARERTCLASERNRLAAIRTFNAWIRTGLAGVGGGIAVIKFIPFSNEEHRLAADLIGEFLMLWGIALFFYALYEYVKNCKDTDAKPSYIPMILITVSLVVVSFLLFLIVKQ